MPVFDVVIFDSQTQIDSFNASLNQGLILQAIDSEGQLVITQNQISSLFAVDHGLSQTQVDEINTLPTGQIFIPDINERLDDLQDQIDVLAGNPFSDKNPVTFAPVGQFDFVLEGDSTPSGKFMTVATKAAIPSNLTPAILPVPTHIISMVWMNEIDNANEDIEILLDGSLVYTWQLRNARWGILNAQDETLPILSIPDMGKISVRIRNDSPPSAKDGYLFLIFRMVGNSVPGLTIGSTL